MHALVLKLKHRGALPYDANKIFQILSLTLLEKTPVFELFSETQRFPDNDENRNQLILFD